MSRWCGTALLVGLVGIVVAGPVRAAEDPQAYGGVMLVQGRVVSVEPVRSPGPVADCAEPAMPDRDLVALLAWDLRAGCATTSAVSGYRVSYRWDGRTYERIMAQPPRGDTVSLRVRLH